MSERLGLGHAWFAVCLSAAFAFASCTKSHDVELSEQPLTAGSSAAGSGSGVEAGRVAPAAGSGSAGRGTAGATAGRAATAGMGAAGRSTGTAGRAGAAGAAGGAALSCGTCAAANLFGFLMAPACCTTDNKCGLDLTSLGSAMCVEQNAPGTLDPNCPAGTVMGVSLQGCCRSDGTCGTMDTYLGLGCTEATSTQKVACSTK